MNKSDPPESFGVFKPEQAELVAAVAREMNAPAAQRYGEFAIEDLTELT